MRKHIVFCVEHYNPCGLIRSLGESGIKPVAIVLKSKKRITSRSKWISKLYFVNSIEEGYELLLNKYGNEEEIPFLYTADDKITSYVDYHYDELAGHFIFYNAGKAGRINEFMNKDSINKLAIKHGLNVLPTYVVERGSVPDNIIYPVITKSISSIVGGWKNDVFICNNESELKSAYEKILSPTVLLQQYIEKENEYCCDGFSSNGGGKVLIAILSKYKYLLPNTYSPYMDVFNFDNEELERSITNMMTEIGFEGIFEIEFLIGKDKKLYFLEINFRNSTWSYAATRAGMNLPMLWSNAMLEGDFDKNKVTQIIPSGFTAMVEFEDYIRRVHSRQISKAQWIRDFVKADCKYYLGKKDPSPFINEFLCYFKAMMK